ncbi:kinase-like domain-containing protein, partial [Gigaspora rosea]
LKDPTFLKCFGISKDKVSGKYVLVMEYAQCGSLRQNLHIISKMNWKDKLNLLQCIASDLQIIHSHDLIHRDLHSGNIFQADLKSAYIADLGLSMSANIMLKSKSDGVFGILPYIAPEVLEGNQYTTASDIYSLAIIMWEILYGKPITYYQKPGPYLQFQICIDNLRPNIEDAKSCYVDLMKKCWDKEPKNRPSAQQIYEIFINWKDDDKVLLELSEYDKKINQSMDCNNNCEEIYESKFISTNHLNTTNRSLILFRTNEFFK